MIFSKSDCFFFRLLWINLGRSWWVDTEKSEYNQVIAKGKFNQHPEVMWIGRDFRCFDSF
jgi:hypothetical protein